MALRAHRRLRRLLGSIVLVTVAAQSAFAGLTVIGQNGIAATGADGVSFVDTAGIMATGADGVLAFAPNGIAATGADGIAATGADGATFTGTNGIAATGADSVQIVQADGIAATGADGIAVTGADGQRYIVVSLYISRPTGLTVTHPSGIAATGADGIAATGADTVQADHAAGVTTGRVDGIAATGADFATGVGLDGVVVEIAPDGIAATGADGIAATGADGIVMTGVTGIASTGADGIAATGADGLGLQSVDPELALTLDRLTDDSNVNAVVVYYHLPTAADLAGLSQIGILGGTHFHALPMVMVTGTKRQIMQISHLRSVRSIYGNRTLQALSDPTREETGVERAWNDAEIAGAAGGAITGAGVTVAVLDTGLDGLHADLSGRVVQNVKLLDTQGVGVGFNYPIDLENLPNTDLVYGHGTFVGGVIAGSGARSNGKYRGVAPGARLVGLSAGDLDLLHVLAGFDYLLDRGASLGVRVVNCSFSANTVFDVNDPVNVATRMLFDNGISVVVSAGNTGPGWNTMNPYAVAPWVIGVGATDDTARLASFSSRGQFASGLFRPKLVAPGVSVVSLRSSTVVGVTGVLGLESGADTRRLSLTELPFYTTSSGTSFSAPQVAGTIALMLQVNPGLTPARILDILQRSATPLPPYYQHEVGAGMLNAHAAVLEAAFADRTMGLLRATLDRGQARLVNDPVRTFSGTVSPITGYQASVAIPANTLFASVQIGWGPLLTTKDLGLAVYDPAGTKRAESNYLNLPGLTGHRERVTLTSPALGTWRARVYNTLGLLGGSQSVTGTVEIARVDYAPLRDVGGLSAASRDEIYQSLRTFVMSPYGNAFRPDLGVSRSELAATLVRGGRVPQYLPAHSNYSDVHDRTTMTAVESAQAAPGGRLFVDALPGGQFRPQVSADRLAAAVAFVRAAGLTSEAEQRASAPLGVSDAAIIPAELRGYVAVALDRGLLVADGGAFRPASPLTRAGLAHAMAVLMSLATR